MFGKNWQLLFTYTFNTDVLRLIRKHFSIHELCHPLEGSSPNSPCNGQGYSHYTRLFKALCNLTWNFMVLKLYTQKRSAFGLCKIMLGCYCKRICHGKNLWISKNRPTLICYSNDPLLKPQTKQNSIVCYCIWWSYTITSEPPNYINSHDISGSVDNCISRHRSPKEYLKAITGKSYICSISLFNLRGNDSVIQHLSTKGQVITLSLWT